MKRVRRNGRRKWEVSEQGEIMPLAKRKRNFTDTESRMMKDHATNTYVQGYNAQIGVDAHAQIIVAASVVQAGNDQQQLVPVLTKVNENVGRLPEKVSADAGYFSTAAVTHEAFSGIDLYVPPNEPEPIDCESEEAHLQAVRVQDRMWEKLKSKEGRAVFSRRKVIVEPVFAYLKHTRGIRQFLLRGLAQVEAEWLLVCLTHNLLKLFKTTKQPQAA